MNDYATMTLTLHAIGEQVNGTTQSGRDWTRRELHFKNSSGGDLIVTAFNMEVTATIGTKYNVNFYVDSREYNGKYYTGCKLKYMTVADDEPQPNITSDQPVNYATTPRQMSMDMGSAQAAVERSQRRTAELAATQENDLPF